MEMGLSESKLIWLLGLYVYQCAVLEDRLAALEAAAEKPAAPCEGEDTGYRAALAGEKREEGGNEQ